MLWRKFVVALKRAQRRLVLIIQAVILHICLFLLYYIGLGLTRLVMMVFARRTLFDPPPAGTSWRKAEGYDLDALRLTRQS